MTNKLAKLFYRKGLLFQSGLATALKLGAAAFSFVMTLLITRSLGKQEAGFVFTFISVVTIAATFSRMGTDNSILRFIATAGLRDLNFLRRLGIAILGACFIASIIGVIYLMPGQRGVDGAFLIGSVILATCSIALGIFIGFALRGAGLTQSSVWLQSGGLPAFACLLLLIIVLSDVENDAVLTISVFTVAAVANAFIGFSLLVFHRSGDKASSGQEVLPFLLESRPLYLMAVIQVVTQWLPILLIGELSGLAAAAEFQVASRIAMLIGIIQAGLTTVTAPKMAKAWHANDIVGTFSVYRNAARYSIVLSTVAALSIALFSSEIVMLFGDFEKSVPIVMVLLVGQLVGAYSGPIISLLTMTHNQGKLKLPSLMSGFCVVFAGYGAGQAYGAMGVAVAVACATAIQNALALFAAKKTLGITYFKT